AQPLVAAQGLEAEVSDPSAFLAAVCPWCTGHGAVPVAGVFCRAYGLRHVDGVDPWHHAVADHPAGVTVDGCTAEPLRLVGLPALVLRPGPVDQRRAAEPIVAGRDGPGRVPHAHGVVVLRGLLPAAQALATADSDLGVALRAGVLRAGGAAAGVPVEPFGATDGAEPAAGGLCWPVCLGAGTWALEPCAGGGWGREDRRIHESHAVVHWFAGGAAAG